MFRRLLTGILSGVLAAFKPASDQYYPLKNEYVRDWKTKTESA